jgi:DNA-binding CsgD family transcriptional regulator
MVLSTSHALLKHSMLQVKRETGLPVVFGGPVDDRGLLLSVFAGMHTDSLDGLLVARDHGLGGRAVQVRSPVAVTEYQQSPVISHAYDRQVGTEGLVSLVAVPAVSGTVVRAVLYGALRRKGPVGDTAVDALVQAARRLGQLLERATVGAVADPYPPSIDHGALSRIVAEAREAARHIRDSTLRDRVRASCDRFVDPPGGEVAARPVPQLTPRELDVLALAATACGNDAIAGFLGISEHAVKYHVRHVMKVLGAGTRHAAVSEARAQGILR